MRCTFCPHQIFVSFALSDHLLGSEGKKDRLFRVESLSKVTAPNHNPTQLGYMLQVVTLKGASRVLWVTHCPG